MREFSVWQTSTSPDIAHVGFRDTENDDHEHENYCRHSHDIDDHSEVRDVGLEDTTVDVVHVEIR